MPPVSRMELLPQNYHLTIAGKYGFRTLIVAFSQRNRWPNLDRRWPRADDGRCSISERTRRDGHGDYRIGSDRRDGLAISSLDGNRAHPGSSRNGLHVALCSICWRASSCAHSGSGNGHERSCHARSDCKCRPHVDRIEANLQLPVAVDPVAALSRTTGLTKSANVESPQHRPLFFDPG